jgi:branched-chain amino acid transport system substrate-binding protein
MDVDKVDLTIGPYATNMVAPAIVTLMEHKRLTIAFFGVAANSEFHYPKYFSMVSLGPDPKITMSRGYFELAAQQTPRPKTVAIVGADAEFARNTTDGARQNAKSLDFDVVYDKSYPPGTTDFGPIIRAVQATAPDMVFAAAYPPDTLGLVRAANEIGLKPKVFGGGLIGLLATGMKLQLGPLLNGIVKQDLFVNSPNFEFPGLREMLRKYQAKAPEYGVIRWGTPIPPSAMLAVRFSRKPCKELAASTKINSLTTCTTTPSTPSSAGSALAKMVSGASHKLSGHNFKASATIAWNNFANSSTKSSCGRPITELRHSSIHFLTH